MQSIRNNAIVIGALVGLTLGVTAGWVYSREKQAREISRGNAHPLRLQASPADFAKLGIALLALVRQVDDLFKPS